GLLDVVAAEQQTDTISVLRGNGDGTFARPLAFAASGANFTPESMAVSDLNGDGRADLVINSISVLDSDAFQLGVLLGNGKGVFQAPTLSTPQPGRGGDLALGDFNNDGLTDAAVAENELGAPPGDLAVFRGNADGTFQSQIRLNLPTGGNDPEGVAAADLYRGGLADLLAATFFSNSDAPSTVGVLLTSSTFVTPAVTASFGAGTLRVVGTERGDTIVVSRDAAGTILVNGGAVAI